MLGDSDVVVKFTWSNRVYSRSELFTMKTSSSLIGITHSWRPRCCGTRLCWCNPQCGRTNRGLDCTAAPDTSGQQYQNLDYFLVAQQLYIPLRLYFFSLFFLVRLWSAVCRILEAVGGYGGPRGTGRAGEPPNRIKIENPYQTKPNQKKLN